MELPALQIVSDLIRFLLHACVVPVLEYPLTISENTGTAPSIPS